MNARALVVGDVHGCADELDALLQQERPEPGELYLVGDLVAKGPDSAGVLSMVRERGARSVRGNHDQHVLKLWAARDADRPLPPAKLEHVGLVHRLSRSDLEWLGSLPLWLRLPAFGALIVHAGLVPGIPLEEQDPDLLLNLRTLREDGTGSRKHDAGVLWGSRYSGPELVVFGHHARRGLQLHPHAVGLDTGCVYGGRLSALWLPEHRVVSVPARRAYVEVE